MESTNITTLGDMSSAIVSEVILMVAIFSSKIDTSFPSGAEHSKLGVLILALAFLVEFSADQTVYISVHSLVVQHLHCFQHNCRLNTSRSHVLQRLSSIYVLHKASLLIGRFGNRCDLVPWFPLQTLISTDV